MVVPTRQRDVRGRACKARLSWDVCMQAVVLGTVLRRSSARCCATLQAATIATTVVCCHMPCTIYPTSVANMPEETACCLPWKQSGCQQSPHAVPHLILHDSCHRLTSSCTPFNQHPQTPPPPFSLLKKPRVLVPILLPPPLVAVTHRLSLRPASPRRSACPA